LRDAFQASSDNLPVDERQAQHRRAVLEFLDNELRRCELKSLVHGVEEKYEQQARATAAVLPDAATLDKILRYQTTLERQLYRAMNQLERLQRRRAGEHIPAPLAMEIGMR